MFKTRVGDGTLKKNIATAAVLALGTLTGAAFQFGTAFGVPQPAASPNNVTMNANRIGGADREDTAVKVADNAFGNGTRASVAVLARDDSFADALAGNALAAQKNGPLLVTPTGSLNAEVQTELQKILPKGAPVYLLGGTSALSDNVFAAVQRLGFTPRRLAGPDRYATAVAIAKEISPHPHSILVATGNNAPDALAAGAAASTDGNGGVVLLSNDKVMPASTAAYLAGVDPASRAVYGVGVQGAAALSTQARFAGKFTAFRGSDRFDTDAQIASNTTLYPNPTSFGLASGEDGHWPDALAGGAYVGLAHAPLLLAHTSSIAPQIAAWLTAHAGSLTSVTTFGGKAVVDDNAVAAAIRAAGGTPPSGGPRPGPTPTPTPVIVPPTPSLKSDNAKNTATVGQVVAYDA